MLRPPQTNQYADSNEPAIKSNFELTVFDLSVCDLYQKSLLILTGDMAVILISVKKLPLYEV